MRVTHVCCSSHSLLRSRPPDTRQVKTTFVSLDSPSRLKNACTPSAVFSRHEAYPDPRGGSREPLLSETPVGGWWPPHLTRPRAQECFLGLSTQASHTSHCVYL